MRWSREAICQKRTELRKNQSWSLQHNNAPAHPSMFVREFLAKNKRIIMSKFIGLGTHLHFPLPTFWPLKGKRFATIEEIQEKSKQKLMTIPKRGVQKYFKDCNKRWHKYIISERGFWKKWKNRYFLIIHPYIIGHYNPSVRIINLVSHTTYVVCVLILK